MATDIIARGMITEYKSGTNISFKENDDGSVTISASGNISSEDTVARDTIDNHKHDKNNPHNVTAEQVGLGNVDNTADLDKPISNATQAELDEKAEKVHTHLVEEITDFPDSLPANGGNADTVNNHTVDSDVPDNAVFTDTTNSDVAAAGNPVQLDGLQGGVPFSEMAVSGDYIIGQELTVNVSGKNVLKYPYVQTTRTSYGITFTDNGDGSITASGTHDGGANISYFGFSPWWATPNGGRLFLPKGNTVTLRVMGLPNTYQCQLVVKKDNTSTDTITVVYGIGKSAANYTAEQDCYIACGIIGLPSSVGQAVNFTAYPQLELGDTATEYESYHGNTTTIIPTSNPYVIPNDIRQVDGYNVITVSEGELYVTGVRKNAAVKRIWDEIDEIKTAIIVSNGESE